MNSRFYCHKCQKKHDEVIVKGFIVEVFRSDYGHNPVPLTKGILSQFKQRFKQLSENDQVSWYCKIENQAYTLEKVQCIKCGNWMDGWNSEPQELDPPKQARFKRNTSYIPKPGNSKYAPKFDLNKLINEASKK